MSMKKLIAVLFAVGVIASLNHIANEEDPRLSLVKPTSSTSSTPPSTSTTTITQTPGAVPPQATATQPPSTVPTSGYKDGAFTGQSVDNPYGTVQISAVIAQGKITDINFLKMPSDLGHSAMLSQMSEPLLKQTTLDKQSANIDFVSGATYTSESYQQSLQSALDQARA